MDPYRLWLPLSLPFILITFDIVFKRFIFKRLPYDSMSDMALAALAFGSVHYMLGLLSAESYGLWVAYAFLIIAFQLLLWILFMSLGRVIERHEGKFVLRSYAAGACWFTFSAGLLLLIVPFKAQASLSLGTVLLLLGFSVAAGSAAAGAGWLFEKVFEESIVQDPRHSLYDWGPFVGLIRNLQLSRPFVSVKWLREKELAHDWEMVQALQVALDTNMLETYSVPNPSNPNFPVTACRLNMSHPIVAKLTQS
jgi:hypothetical protein